MNIRRITSLFPKRAEKVIEKIDPREYVHISSLFRQMTKEHIESISPMIANYAKHEDVFVSISPGITAKDMVEQTKTLMERNDDEIIVAIRNLKGDKRETGIFHKTDLQKPEITQSIYSLIARLTEFLKK